MIFCFNIHKVHEKALSLSPTSNTEFSMYKLYSIENISIPPGSYRLLRTGLIFDVPAGFIAQLSTPENLVMDGIFSSPTNIGPEKSDEITIVLHNGHPQSTFNIKEGDCIANMCLLSVLRPEIRYFN